MPAGISCWRVRSGLCSQGEVTAMLPGSEQGMERGLGSPECAGCPLTFLSVQGHSPECATISCPACGHSRTQLLTLHPTSIPSPSPHATHHQEGNQEAGNARGSRSIPGQQEGCWGAKDAPEGRSVGRMLSRAEAKRSIPLPAALPD